MRIKIDVNLKMPEASAVQPQRKPSLEERIDYAIECIECGHHTDQAIEFLDKTYKKLLQAPKMTDKIKALLEKIDPVLGEYGSYLFFSKGE